MYKSKFFNLGFVTLSANVDLERLINKRFARNIDSAIRKFCKKDWGKAPRNRKKQNEENLKHPEDLCLFGMYETCEGDIWIIRKRTTENSKKDVTTIVFPDEYMYAPLIR